jgi:hypothetical protein
MPWTYDIKYTTVEDRRCEERYQMQVLYMTPPAWSNVEDARLSPSLHQCSFKCNAQTERNTCGPGEKGATMKKVVAPDGTGIEDVPCFCDGMCSATDEGACDKADADDFSVPSICADQALCQQLCDASKDCYGIEMSKDPNTPNRCFLLHSACALDLLRGELIESDHYDYLAKMDPETKGGDEACPLGVSVTAGGLSDLAGTCPITTINDLYNPAPLQSSGAIDTYVSVSECSSRGSSQLVWHHSGCGWAVTVPAPLVDTTAPPPPPEICDDPFCQNNAAAANWIFGNDDAEYDADICSVTKPWLHGDDGYCQNQLWQALCPQSCGTPCRVCESWANDNEDAAVLIVTMLDELDRVGDATDCETLKAASMCGDPVVQVVCAGTCAGDRRLDGAIAMPHRTHGIGRRLGIELGGSRIELYGTWDPTDLPDFCAPGPIRRRTSPDVSILGNGVRTLFDLHTFNRPVPELTLGKLCPPQPDPVYDTLSNHYCAGNNMPLQSAPEQIQAETCWRKCLDAETLAASNTAGPDDYCDGMDPAFNKYSNALCVPREQCEALCNSLEECTGIEMHTSKPRCYLNVQQTCPVALTYSSEYDLSMKKTDRVAYKTHFRRECKLSMTGTWDTLNAEQDLCKNKCDIDPGNALCKGYEGTRDEEKMVCAERERCEELCTNDIDCAGFSMMNSVEVDGKMEERPRCLFMKVPAANKKGVNLGSSFCTDCKASLGDGSCTLSFLGQPTAKTIESYDSNAEWTYVEKKPSGGAGSEVWEVPCRADVRGLGASLSAHHDDQQVWQPYSSGTDDCADSPYDGSAEGGPCYVSSSKEFRLVWGSLDRFDETTPATDKAGPTSGASLDRKCDGWVLEQKLDLGTNVYTPLFTTYQNGSHCNKDAEIAQLPDTWREQHQPLYRWRAEVAPVAQLSYKCNSYPTCGTLNTCVLSRGRFETELAIMFAGVATSRQNYLADLSQEDRALILGDNVFKPKALICVEHAKAFISRAKWNWAAELYRNVPGPLRVRVRHPGDFDKAIISMASSHDPIASMRELGVEYPVITGYSSWYTDIIRIERFKIDGSPFGVGSMQLDLYAPDVPELVLFKMSRDGTVPVPLETVAATDYPGWWTATIFEDGDYIGTTKRPCPQIPDLSSIPNAMHNGPCQKVNSGQTCPLVCALGFSAVSPLKCELGQWTYEGQNEDVEACQADKSYEPETQLFRLTHRSRLDYGWRIRGMFFYSDRECSNAIKDGAVLGTSGDYAGFPPNNLVQTNENDLKDETRCTQGSECPDWWSAGLNVNPYEVDETHGSAVHVDVQVPASADVQCVRVISRSYGEGQRRQYFPSEQVLYRGWETNVRQSGSLTPSPVTIDGWTSGWFAKADLGEAGDSGMITTFITQCGELDTIIYAELLEYDDNVPSACHCQQLCIDNIDRGCRTWKFKVPENAICTGKKCADQTTGGLCYLQSDFVSKVSATDGGVGCSSALGWISGDTGLRLTGASPLHIAPGKSFDLQVHGVNMPAGARTSTPPRQRIKIVSKGQSCAESAIAQTVSGIRCSHPYFCAPKPSSWESAGESATWSNLKIHASASDQEYTLCYNRGATYDRWEWHEVPTSLMIDSNNFKWHTTPRDLTRTSEQFNLTITSLSLPVAPEEWQIKIIRSYFDCADIDTDSAKFGVPIDSVNSGAFDVTWPDIAFTGGMVDAGRYKICFAASDGDSFLPVPGLSGDMYLEIAGHEEDSTHPREVFTYQTLSGKLDQEMSLVLGGHRLRLPSQSSISIAPGGAKCGEAAPIHTAQVAEAESDENGYAFKLTVSTDEAGGIAGPGTFDVCYCDAQTDTSLDLDPNPNTTDSDSTYQLLAPDAACTPTPLNVTDRHSTLLASTDVHSDYQEHFCAQKCARGCSGQNCFCDSFDPDTMMGGDKNDAGMAGPLCASAPLCRDACEASDDCGGFDFDPVKNFCWLRSSEPCALTTAERFETWDRKAGTACTNASDFSVIAGVITLTSRPDINNAWVITPGEVQSIEVTGANLDWNYDRLMLIEGTGTCGISGPSPSVSSQPGVAENDFVDGPSNDGESAYTAPPDGPGPVVYNKKIGHYCSGNNLDVTQITQNDLHRHQCYRKCSVNAPCEGEDCFCDGLYAGYDGLDSAALCLSLDQCRSACASLADCIGIDMHNERNRCFLNAAQPTAPVGSCEQQVTDSTLTEYASYTFYYKQADSGRLRRLLPVEDTGISWSELLRFKNVLVPTGGYLKACFCDPQTLSTATCRSKSDYKVEVGIVHVSGVSCLISDPKLQRGACHEQRYKGLRCYESDIINPQPPALATLPSDDSEDHEEQVDEAEQVLSSWCLYGPEEETRNHPDCRSARA